MVKVYVGSEKDLKQNAMEALFILLGYDPKIIGFKARSDVPEQPRNFPKRIDPESDTYESVDETMRGAHNRMTNLLEKLAPASEPCIATAVENGIFYKLLDSNEIQDGKTIIGRAAEKGMQPNKPGWVDIAILGFKVGDAAPYFVDSTGVVFPTEYVKRTEALSGSYEENTVGELMSQEWRENYPDPEKADELKKVIPDHTNPQLDIAGITRLRLILQAGYRERSKIINYLTENGFPPPNDITPERKQELAERYHAILDTYPNDLDRISPAHKDLLNTLFDTELRTAIVRPSPDQQLTETCRQEGKRGWALMEDSLKNLASAAGNIARAAGQIVGDLLGRK